LLVSEFIRTSVSPIAPFTSTTVDDGVDPRKSSGRNQRRKSAAENAGEAGVERG
jgi:hypothetical protein